MNTWQVGNVKITRIIELEVTGGSRFILPEATPEAVLPISWLAPHFIDSEGKLIMSIHALIIESGGTRIMVDTCLGNDKSRSIPAWNLRTGPFLADIAKAGFPRESIDTVLCTHLHVDHVGWNTMLVNSKWVPTFPNARYLMGTTEFEYWTSDATGQDYGDVIADSVMPVFEAGLVDLVATDHKLTDEIWLESTPGHTPGHVSVHISSAGKEALITGDCFHHPCQIARPAWTSSADYDSELGIKTRQDLLQNYADNDTLIIGTHFATPTAGYIRNAREGYYLETLTET